MRVCRAKTVVPRHMPDADAGVLLMDDRGITRLTPPVKPSVTKAAVAAKASSHKSGDTGSKVASKGVSHGKPAAKPVPPAPSGVLAGGVILSDQ